jgi:TRAP-type C4-dicarboxylate transport system permease small subunit
MKIVKKLIPSFSEWILWLTIAATIIMFFEVLSDVIGTKVFRRPMPISVDFIGYLALLVGGGALSSTLLKHRFIEVEFVVDKFPNAIKQVINLFIALMGLGIFSLLTWRGYYLFLDLKLSQAITNAYNFPQYPFAAIFALCCLITIPSCLLQVIESITDIMRRK